MKDLYSFASLLLRGLALLLFILLDTLAQYSAPVTDTLKWKNIASQYKNFVELRPILVNDGKESIFLSRIWPHGYAQLQRWHETTGRWETGDWGIGCGTVSKATIPIEIKPGTEQEVHVYWQLSMNDWERPKHFVVEDTDEKRPLKGKYRFFLRYAKLPWTLAHRPGKIYILESPEFQVTSYMATDIRVQAPIRRLPPKTFPQLPAAIVENLEARKCLIPQSWHSKIPHNVIRGSFTGAKSNEWAVLCSRRGTSSILVFRADSGNLLAEIAAAKDETFQQDVDGHGTKGYSRAISVAGKDFTLEHHKWYGGPEPPPVTHQGINDAFIEKASVVRYFYRGNWLELQGTD